MIGIAQTGLIEVSKLTLDNELVRGYIVGMKVEGSCMAITASGFHRVAELVSQVPEPELKETLFDHLVRLAAQKFGPTSTFGRRATDRVDPYRFKGWKKAQALEAILRQHGRFLNAVQAGKLMKDGGCEMPASENRYAQVLSVVVATHSDKFIGVGDPMVEIGLVESQQQVA